MLSSSRRAPVAAGSVPPSLEPAAQGRSAASGRPPARAGGAGSTHEGHHVDVGAASEVVDRVRAFFSTRIWRQRPSELTPARAALHRVSRVGYAAVRGYFDHSLTFRAAALTYFTVLSIVPFLAFAFAIVKGLGAYRALVDGTIRPWLQDSFGANPSLYRVLDGILRFVEQTDVSKLGTFGLLVLVYTSVSLVSNVEVALNRIWGAKSTRPVLRQVTDYVTLLVTTPILILAATTLSAAAQSSSAVEFVREALRLGPVIDLLLRLTPVVVVWIGLFAMYVILPNVRVRAASAALGAAVAAVLWHLALVLHVQSQIDVARYNALYSVIGAIPIFLVWTYLSWLVVLVGAELAASHQNEQALSQHFRARDADPELREWLAVAVAARVTRDFLDGARRRTSIDLAELLEVPPPVVDDVLSTLCRAGLLARTVSGHEIGYVPGRDIDAVRAADLREGVRRDPHADELRAAAERRLGPELARLLRGLDEDARRSPSNLTLRDLAAAAGANHDDPGKRRPPRPDGDGSAGTDPKQPDASA